jgi:branched-chain amino acid transport system substrate-binding protein
MKAFSAGRRSTLQASAALATGLALGFPAINRAQGEVVRIGRLTPRTGFLDLVAQHG